MSLTRVGAVIVALLLLPTTAHAFVVNFTHARGNNWWVETNAAPIDNDGAVASVDARVNAGSWVNLPRTSWGSYARGFFVATGSVVEFRARNAAGAVYLSGGYLWSSSPTQISTGGGTGSTFQATFSNVHGNAWWLETNISANQTVAGADVRINAGLWRAMARTSWGSWSASFQVGRGAIVEFRARTSTGAVASSAGYLWPDATLVGAPGDHCSAGCSSGRLCCQVSPLADVADSTKRFGCLSPVNGSCPAPDLRVDADELASWYLETRTFGSASCAVAEQCVNYSGTRKLLRFSTLTTNLGTRDLVLGDPTVSPNLFEYGTCHGHYHFEGYASYRLVRADGSLVGTGRKQSFCLGDNLHLSGSTYDPQYNCNYQGLTAGWADEYGASLDCQWIDVTNVPAGSYYLEVTVNPARSLFESNFTNNTARVPVTIR